MAGPILNDWKVSFKSRETIAGLADKLRTRLGFQNENRINAAQVLRLLLDAEFPTRGKLTLINIESTRPFVSYIPTFSLHINFDLLDDADLGDPDANYKIMHEIGHLILHNSLTMHFSISGQAWAGGVQQDEESAEWQAHCFARCFLAPDRYVRAFKDAKSLAETMNLNLSVAETLVHEVIQSKKNYTGDICSECQNFTLVRNGTWLKCDTCGGNMGGN